MLFDYYYMVRSLALPHIRHARLLEFLLHFHTYVMLRCWTFSCTSTHTSCYAAGRSCASTHTSCYAARHSLALPHIHHATLLDVLLHFHTCVMLRCWAFSCKKKNFSRKLSGHKITVSLGKTLGFPILRRPFHGIAYHKIIEEN